jgi:hypothetical protein
MRFQEAFELGKKYLWPSRAPKGAGAKPRHQFKVSKPFRVYPAKGILKNGEEFHREGPQREVNTFGIGRMALLLAGRKDTDYQEINGGAAYQKTSAVQRLLDSFPIRKNAELNEFVRRSKFTEPEDQADDQMGEIFALTKKLLAKILGPLDLRLIRDPDLLERALGKVHPRLPIIFRLFLRKKQYIQFMLDNRERLVP